MELNEILEIYTNWIRIFIEYARKGGISDDEINKSLKYFPPVVSDKEPMFMTYCHDDPRDLIWEVFKVDTRQ